MPDLYVRGLGIDEKARMSTIKKRLGAKAWADVLPDAFEALARERLM